MHTKHVERDAWQLDFADRLYEARCATGLSQAKFAERAGMHANTLCNYETGDHTPDGYTLMKLCRELGISADWLLGLEEVDG